ncbi:YDG/SRA domain-containing protein [Hamadaea sp. NPDC050747]|uniref:YDG/SRA domain-containing protein n=1 Tax=Hamadaea sp. NPDC050747 TaxID=3155789 RepID=UPI0033DA8444
MRPGRPVRLIRGRHRKSRFAPSAGFRYDGLYKVTDHWRAKGQAGFVMCFYSLEFVNPDDQLTVDLATLTDFIRDPKQASPKGNVAPVRGMRSVVGWIRDTKVTSWVKLQHRHTCQICRTRIVLRGKPHAHGAHIDPIAHGGPDVPENVLCLCPNCHVQFDADEIRIDPDLNVRGGLIAVAKRLNTVEAHTIDPIRLEIHDELHFPH